MAKPPALWSRIVNSLWVRFGIAGAMTATCAAGVMLAFQSAANSWGSDPAGAGTASLAAIIAIAIFIGVIATGTGIAQRIASMSGGTTKPNGKAIAETQQASINEIKSRIPNEPSGETAQAPTSNAHSMGICEHTPVPAPLFADCYSGTHSHLEAIASSPDSSTSPDRRHNPYAWLRAAGRILLAETNDHDRRAIAAMMDRCGMEVETAADAEDAIEMLLAAHEFGEPFDMALIDAYMPHSDGFSVCRAIRSAGIGAEAMPIITLLPDALIGDATRRTPAQSQAYIFKPVMMEDLVRTLNRWLPHRIVEESARPTDDPLDNLDIDEVEDELQRWIALRSDAVTTIEQAIAHHAFDGRSRRLLANALRQIARTAGLYGEEELGKRAAILERALYDGDAAGDCRKLAEAFLAAAQQIEDA